MKPFLLVLSAAAALLSGCDDNHLITPRPDVGLTQPTPGCAYRAFFAATALEDREGWYGTQLRAAGEHVLRCLPGDSGPIYRFLWVPTFHHTVVVRVEPGAIGYRITAKTLSGAGGYDPGALAHEVSYELNDADMGRFTQLVVEARFWELPTVPLPGGMMGLDGSQWVFEALEGARYHVVDRWSPRPDGPDAAYRRLGEWLLAHSALAPASLVQEY
jgi:hypothetical protein